MTTSWQPFTSRAGLRLEARQNLSRDSIGVAGIGAWGPGAWLVRLAVPGGSVRQLVADAELFAALFQAVEPVAVPAEEVATP